VGWVAREVYSNKVEGLRCFLCCNINVIIPCEFAGDVDTKVIGRSDSLEGTAMEVVLCLYWSSFPRKGDGLNTWKGWTPLASPFTIPGDCQGRTGVCWCHAWFWWHGTTDSHQQTSDLWNKLYSGHHWRKQEITRDRGLCLEERQMRQVTWQGTGHPARCVAYDHWETL